MQAPTPTPIVDAATAARIRDEWQKVERGLKGRDLEEVNDPLGDDGVVAVLTNSFRKAGGGEVVLRKGQAPDDHRYTKFRAYGDVVEKSSYLVKANGSTEFHRRTVEGDKVIHVDEIQPEDQTWIDSLT